MARKILLMTDQQLLIDVLERKLKGEGYEVWVAKDGVEGLEKMKEMKPDLVLLDLILPRMEGFEVMEEMAKDEGLKKIPVIVMSTFGQPVELDRAKRLGAKDWVIKAKFDPQEVVDKVAKQIGR